MKHDRLKPIPGCEVHPRHRRRAHNEATALMASDALSGLDFRVACDVVEAHFEARPDVIASEMEALADRLRRMAWAREREGETP